MLFGRTTIVTVLLLSVLLLPSRPTHAELRLQHRKLRMAKEGDGIDNQYIVSVKTEKNDGDAKQEPSNTFLRSGGGGGGGTSTISGQEELLSDCIQTIKDKEVSMQALGDGSDGLFAINGFLDGTALTEFVNCDDVEFLEQDQVATVYAATSTQDSPPWGLDRISQDKPSPLKEEYPYDYTGQGVKVYVLDTGILTTHTDFGSRATTCESDEDNKCDGGDSNGHGTHVAGTIGGSIMGVAKEVELISIKVLNDNGRGSTSSIISGLEYVLDAKRQDPSQPMVVNLSVGLGQSATSTALEQVLQELYEAGVVVVAAAGNYKSNACATTPASSSYTLTVGATNRRDRLWDHSSYGPCVDLFAPGFLILSNWNSGNTNVKSGTSSAAPHVSGAVALLLEQDPNLSPDDIRKAILEEHTMDNVISGNLYGSPNKLLTTQSITETNNKDDADDEDNDSEDQCLRFLYFCDSNEDCCSDQCFFGILCF